MFGLELCNERANEDEGAGRNTVDHYGETTHTRKMDERKREIFTLVFFEVGWDPRTKTRTPLSSEVLRVGAP